MDSIIIESFLSLVLLDELPRSHGSRASTDHRVFELSARRDLSTRQVTMINGRTDRSVDEITTTAIIGRAWLTSVAFDCKSVVRPSKIIFGNRNRVTHDVAVHIRHSGSN